MIPRDYITEWRRRAPWVQDFQVEQDLVISRALVDIFSHPLLHVRVERVSGSGSVSFCPPAHLARGLSYGVRVITGWVSLPRLV